VSSTSPRPNLSPATASRPYRNAHPPCADPSLPSGSWMTPSRDTNSMTMTLLITLSFAGSCLPDEREPVSGTGGNTDAEGLAWVWVRAVRRGEGRGSAGGGGRRRDRRGGGGGGARAGRDRGAGARAGAG